MGMYVDRLSKVMLAQIAAFEADKTALEDAEERLEDAAREFDQLKAIESMFGGETDTSIRNSATKLTRVIEQMQSYLSKTKSATALGQTGIETAQHAYTSLPSGSPSFVEQALGTAAKVLLPGVGIIAGEAFLSWVTAQREARREELAREALMKLSGDMSNVNDALFDIHRLDFDQKQSNPGDSNTNTNSKDSTGNTTETTPQRPKAVDLTQPQATVPGATAADRVRQAIERGMNSIRYDDSAGVNGATGYPGVIAPKTPLPNTDQWPFDVYHPGDINRDGPLKGGYRVNLDSSISEMPRDPMLRSTIEEGRQMLGGNLGALGVAGAAVGAGALALGAGRGGATAMSMPGSMAAGAPMSGASGAGVAGARGGMGMMGGMVGGAPGAAGSGANGRGGNGRAGAGRAGGVGRAGGMGAAAGRGAMAGAGARGGMGMMGGVAGGAPGTAAGDKNNAKSQGKGSRFGGAGTRGAAGSMGRGAGAGVGAGARGGMIGGIAGGAPGSAAANGKGANPQGKGRLGGGAGSATASRGAAGARGGMLGGMLGAGARGGADEKQQREKTTYGASGVEFFDLAQEQQLGKAGRSGKVSNDVIQVVDADDSRW